MESTKQVGCWWCKRVTVPARQRYFKAHAAPQGLCGNLINALKLQANQQKDGDSTIQSIVTGLRDRSRELGGLEKT